MLKKLLCVSVLALGMVGCASVKMAAPADDSVAKQFVVKTDKAGLYIFRNESMGGAVTMDVKIDGKAVGQTAAKTYIFTELSAGSHVITSDAENTSEITIEVESGKLYYVWQEVKMGVLSARSKLQQVDEQAGKKGVNESKLVAPLSAVAPK